MNRAKLIAIAPQLVVTDVRKTAHYYRDKLGFSILGIVGEPPVYAMVSRDGFQVHFAISDNWQINKNRDLRSIAHDYIIWVPEIDAFYNELAANNVKIVEEIQKRVYGSREFVFEDFDGHIILVGD